MSDFDLSQALEGPESDEVFEPRCCDMTEVQEEIFRLEEGLDLVVSHNPKTMRHMATLLLAVNRMKKSLPRYGRKLSEHELCSVIMGSLVEELIVETRVNDSAGVNRKKFQRIDSGKLCTLCDVSQKDVVHGSELTLEAITLKGGHCDRKVNFKMSRYITPNGGESQTVGLFIASSKLHISCSMKDGRAVLILEKCCEEDLKMISDDGNMDRFLFYKRAEGISLTTFESVKCRGWFISTSYEGENQPVEMCEADTTQRLTSFKMN